MKRKLIEFDTFKKIKEGSLSLAEAELKKAEGVLASALGTEDLKLHCFGKDNVVYETLDRNYIHSTYRMDKNHIILENIEELVIDEQTAKIESKNILKGVVENILENNDKKASSLFSQYLAMPHVRRSMTESAEMKEKKKKKKENPFKKLKSKLKVVDDDDEECDDKEEDKKKPTFGKGKFPFFKKHAVKASKKKLEEWTYLVENLVNYLHQQEVGPVARQSEVRRDERGNVTALRIPTSKLRNESKILQMQYKHMLDTNLKVLRGKAKVLPETTAFCRAMSDLRKTNAMSDEPQLQQVLEAVVTKWPDLLYLTQAELANKIGVALETAGETNYDDHMLDFLAEGILRTATNVYQDRVQQISRLSGTQLDRDNVYESFQVIAATLYPNFDKATQVEYQVFADLYEALREVYSIALNEGNEDLRDEANVYLRELYAVLQQEAEPSEKLASEATGWLANLIEANVSGASEDWDVSNTPYQTVSGDHPKMFWAAKQTDNAASKYTGDWGGYAPVSDGKSYRNGMEDEMRNHSWGQAGNEKDLWPEISNPNVLKPFGDYRMKGEKNAANDGENDFSRYQSSETWPNLKNDNQKPSPWSPDRYKAKAEDLVVDK